MSGSKSIVLNIADLRRIGYQSAPNLQDSIVVYVSDGEVVEKQYLMPLSQLSQYLVSQGGGFVDLSFNGNRAITRAIPSLQGVNLGTIDIPSFLEKAFFPSVGPQAFLSIEGGNIRRFGETPNVVLDWQVIKHSYGITTITVVGQSFTSTISTDTLPDNSSQSGTKNSTSTQNVNTSFSMSAGTTHFENVVASTTLIWENERFWFVSSTDLINTGTATTLSTLLNGMSGSNREFSTTKTQNKPFSPVGQFIYLCWPSGYGGNISTDFSVNGLPNTDWQQRTFAYTNDALSPYTTNFLLTRTQNLLNANFNVTVS